MPTFRDDVKLGTKVPLIKTDDISNNAVSEEKLSKTFRRKVDEIGEMTKEEMEDIVKSSELINVGASLKKAKRKKVKQVIIGRAIKPTSVSRSDVENWYAFIDNPSLVVRNTKKFEIKEPEIHLYVKRIGEYNSYQEIEVSICSTDMGASRTVFQCDSKYVMYKVDQYERAGYKHYIHLTYKQAPLTLKGTSLTNEWQNGKRVHNKKISKKLILDDLKCWIIEKEHFYNLWEYRRITSRRRTCWIREMANHIDGVKYKVRKEVSWLLNRKGRKNKLSSGLFKVRMHGKKTTAWQTIYVSITRDKEGNRIVRDIILK